MLPAGMALIANPRASIPARRRLPVLAVWLALAAPAGMAAAEGAPGRLHRYTVAIDEGLATLSVRACFDGAPPAELVAESLDAPLVLMEARIEGRRGTIEPSGSLSLRHVPDNGCITYAVNVSKPIRQHDRTDGKVRRLGRDLLTSVGLWLWRPARLGADEDVEVSFALREGLNVSAPWQPLAQLPDRAVFRLGHAPADEPAHVAFGRFQERELAVGGAKLRLAVLEGSPPAPVDAMAQWLEEAARAVAGLYGRFPVAQAQVLVVPDARGAEPTPWAHVMRGGAPAVHFFVNQRRPLAEFREDWTAVHEFSHLLLPLINRDDAWLYEGMATYYQNILRVRTGSISAGQGWTMMHAGFLRGRDDAGGMTLAQATESMYRNGAYMRVYWEGAALMLMADVRLRQMTEGKQSLDTALAGFNDCCASSERAWSARELLDRLDGITGTHVFRDLYDLHVTAREFPDLAPTYRALGIVPTATGVELAGAGRESRLRASIMEAAAPGEAPPN
ncbi:MAG TPA: hypothetical protein VHA15_05350 [Burkholderiales bacterium]|nr:hypothetical protein [Burkholderiales bacterium]